MANAYDDPNHEDQLVLMVEGEACDRLGDGERAPDGFGRIQEIHGAGGFDGEQRRYRALCLEGRSAHADQG